MDETIALHGLDHYVAVRVPLTSGGRVHMDVAVRASMIAAFIAEFPTSTVMEPIHFATDPVALVKREIEAHKPRAA